MFILVLYKIHLNPSIIKKMTAFFCVFIEHPSYNVDYDVMVLTCFIAWKYYVDYDVRLLTCFITRK